MSTFYRKENADYYQTPQSALVNELPNGTYTMGVHPVNGYFFSPIDPLRPPVRLYGDVKDRAQRILHSFQEREGTTGVLLDGLKGTGKTMLCRVLSAKCRDLSIPTIVINQPLRGDAFNQTIQAIGKPILLIFDEFEKVYTHEQQKEVLTLLDGTYQSKKLVLITANDRQGVSAHMLNRPGRILYRFEYGRIDPVIVKQFCQDRLTDESKINDVIEATKLIPDLTFDMLQALIDEMLRFNEDAMTALKPLNIRPEDDTDFNAVVVDKDGKEVHRFIIKGNPATRSYTQYEHIPVEDGKWGGVVRLALDRHSFKRATKEGQLIFETEGYTITCTPMENKVFDWLSE